MVGPTCVTKNDFGPGSNKTQEIVRSLSPDKSMYIVANTLRVGDTTIAIKSVFNRTRAGH